ncbi:tetraspanin-8-like [Impatiens glandulifera]|uniref:tetraspanin-8-like n=1 Tax=Impatiens glandulifera TaxID=253017 RepID=UPI001FB19976|nr:tetraspanin-8-like [Impatiens glandulifera]
MVRRSNVDNPLAMTMITFFLCIVIFIVDIWLSQQVTTHCHPYYLSLALIILPSLLFAFSIIGLILATLNHINLIRFYRWFMFLLIFLMLGVSVSMYVLTVDRSGTLNYTANKNWNKISNCLKQTKICHSHQRNNTYVNTYVIPSGCCTPPSNDCGLNVTSHQSSTNPDCSRWNSDHNVLCYGCETCKIGWMNIIGSNLTWVAITNVIFLFFMVASVYFTSRRVTVSPTNN